MKILIESQIFLAEHPFLIVQLLNVYIKSLCQDDEITVEDSENSKNLTSNWQFALFELGGSHYASVCMEKNKISDGEKMSFLFSILWQFSRPQELPFCSYYFSDL